MKKNNKQRLLGLLIILVGICTMAYPRIANYVNQQFAVKDIADYNTEMAKTEESTIERLISIAKEYNKLLPLSYPADPFSGDGINYVQQQDYQDFELLQPAVMLGYVEVPSAKIYVPMYYGTSNTVLDKGVGVLENSSLPVGGEGTHAVIVGHNGMASRRIFTDLEDVKEGDIFFVHVLNKDFAYQIDQIKTVLPDEVEELRIIKDSDFVTLLTCTPFGVNDHRLLVRGHHIDYDFSQQHDSTVKLLWWQTAIFWPLVISIVILIILVWVFIKFFKKRKMKK